MSIKKGELSLEYRKTPQTCSGTILVKKNSQKKEPSNLTSQFIDILFLGYEAIHLWRFLMILFQLVPGTNFSVKSFELRWSRGIFSGNFRNE